MSPDEEPKLHTGITDVLPESDPRAYDSLHCAKCNAMIHAFNNENMRAWVEFSNVNVCFECLGIPDALGMLCASVWDVTDEEAAEAQGLMQENAKLNVKCWALEKRVKELEGMLKVFCPGEPA